MGESKWDKFLEFFFQSSTILGLIAFASICGIVFADVKIQAILEVAGVFAIIHQLVKDGQSATGIMNYIFQPTTLRALIFSGGIILGRLVPEITIEKIIALMTALVGLVSIFRDEITGELVFLKKD